MLQITRYWPKLSPAFNTTIPNFKEHFNFEQNLYLKIMVQIGYDKTKQKDRSFSEKVAHFQYILPYKSLIHGEEKISLDYNSSPSTKTFNLSHH